MAEIPRTLLLVLALLQSLLLWLLHEGLKGEWIFLADPGRFALAYTLTLALPTVLMLLIRRTGDRFAWITAAVLALVLVPLALHTGDACTRDEAWECELLWAPYVLALTVSLFILTAFLQNLRDRQGLDYPHLFQNAWDNFLSLGATAVFTGAGWLILMLWSALFKVVEISIFEELFRSRAFAYPATGFMVGLGIALGRAQPGAIRAALRVCFALCRMLLPLLSLLALAFAAVLPFTGVAPLWKTGHAASLLLVLVFGLVSLINAVAQDLREDAGVAPWLRRLASAALLTLPVYAGIAAYALQLRVEQHAWSLDRLWAAMLTLFALVYAFGYAVAALRKGPWLAALARINIAAALLLALLLLLTQSPLFNLRGIAADSQVARAERGALAYKDLDYDYLRWQLGQDGVDALKMLLQHPQVLKDAELKRFIERKLAQRNRWEDHEPNPPQPLRAEDFTVIPEGAEVPLQLLLTLGQETVQPHPPASPGRQCREHGIRHCVLFNADLNTDGHGEWILLNPEMGIHGGQQVFTQREGIWKFAGSLSGPYKRPPELQRLLEAPQLKVVEPQWRDLWIGDQRYRVIEQDP